VLLLDRRPTRGPGRPADRPFGAPARPALAERSHSAWLIALVVGGSIARLWNLGGNRLGYDEAFTAMAGRMPLGAMFDYLRTNDSHPPLDYLVHLPLARLGANELVYRLPSVACSIGALTLFAWWMRSRGRVGVVAAAVFAASAFLVQHGRTARGYAELELIGVAVVVLADTWLRRPRRRHAYALAGLVFVGLLTHVSMFLVGAGLLVLAGRRRDADAWRWRAAVVAGGTGWAALWGASFLVQSRGGHSNWIPRTTMAGVFDTISSLTTNTTLFAVPVVVAVVTGGVLLHRRDARTAKVWWSLFGVTAGLAVVGGLALPLLLDRTLTLVAWAPALALGVVVDVVWSRSRALGVAAVVLVLAVLVPPTLGVLTDHSGPTTGLDRLVSVARPGDVVAVHSVGKLPEVEWTLGVRSGQPWRAVTVPGLARVGGVLVGDATPTGRVWVLDWNRRLRVARDYLRCAPDWTFGRSRVVCLQRDVTHPVTVTPVS
jgi:hypothetical protein